MLNKTKKILKTYAKSLGLIGLTSLAGEFIQRHVEPTNLIMLYLLAVVIAASFWGRGPAIFTSLISVLVFDFLFIPPRFTFSVNDAQYLLTFAGLFIVGVVISELTAKTRNRALEASRRENQIELLKAKEKLQAAVLSSISHDVRTPLVSITGALSSILNDKQLDKNTEEELLKTAFEESTRLNRIVENLLDMTRIEAGALQISWQPAEIRDVVGVALEQLKRSLGERKVHIDIPRDLPEVRIDFVLMARVLANIIDNAVKYSPPDSTVHISAQKAGDNLCLRVRDRGFGIPEKDLPNVFNKFYRGERAEKIPGTGLGLSICKGIVEAHKGKLRLESVEKQGTTVIIELPLAGV